MQGEPFTVNQVADVFRYVLHAASQFYQAVFRPLVNSHVQVGLVFFHSHPEIR